MDVSVENDQRRDKSWWDSKTPFQRNLIVGVVTVGVLAGLIIPLTMYSSNTPQEDAAGNEGENGALVIIIGAGPAGIAAASQLLENNITNIIILEAENRMGGRIHSMQFADGVVDLGAQWCHGMKNNLVYELAKDLHVLEDDPYNNIAVYHSSQKFIDRTYIQQLSHIAEELYNDDKDGVEYTLGEFIQKRFNATINENYGSNPKKITLAQEFLNNFHLQVLSNEGAFSWFDVSSQSNFEESEGPYNIGWKGSGYKTILNIITKKYPDPENELPVHEKVLLNKNVVKISSADEKPKVECSDNTTYLANHVIWTPSVGVLKHRHENLFEPGLPQDKIAAIEAVGYGAVSKIFFYFPVRWWPKHVDGFRFIWGKRDSQNVVREFPYGSKAAGKSWLLGMYQMLSNKYNPNVMAAWITGEAVPVIEKLTDDIIINGTMFLLNKFLGHQFRNISRPQKILREKWYSNDNFRGTYSFETIESQTEGVSQHNILSLPITNNDGKPVVLFAGEATNPIHFSTVHGAIETGRREADRIINYYKTN